MTISIAVLIIIATVVCKYCNDTRRNVFWIDEDDFFKLIEESNNIEVSLTTPVNINHNNIPIKTSTRFIVKLESNKELTVDLFDTHSIFFPMCTQVYLDNRDIKFSRDDGGIVIDTNSKIFTEKVKKVIAEKIQEQFKFKFFKE